MTDLDDRYKFQHADTTRLSTDDSEASKESKEPTANSGMTTTAIAPNMVLAGRFRIISQIGRGGMGQVFEAEDMELGERVALKTVLPLISGNENSLARFRREIHLARKVTHANVCRIYDIFHHKQGPGQPRITFLSMELLPGCTLEERIKQRGPMSQEEALPIIEQIAAALVAAHNAKVIHRDLKSSNVMLLQEQEGEPLRAVVTDFGLARSSTMEDASLTAAGVVMGSPAFMAPEQVVGETTSQATDIYSLGVVIYHMLTGHLPFTGKSGLSIAFARVQGEPTPPRTHLPNIDPVWESAILRCLAREPEERFAEIGELIEMLKGEQADLQVQSLSLSLTQPVSQRRRLGLIAALLVLVSLVTGVLLWQPLSRLLAPPAEVAAPVRARPSVAVLGFSNLLDSNELSWLSTALPVLLATELSAGDRVRIIPGENVSRVKVELAIPEGDSLAPDTLSKIRALLGTDYVVLGSYIPEGDPAAHEIRLDLRLQDAQTGETLTLASPSVRGNTRELSALLLRAATEVRGALGTDALSSTEQRAAEALLPAGTEAMRFYSEGLARLHLFDAVSARDLLDKAVREDPDNALIHAALADAWQRLGDDRRTMSAAQAAIERVADLSPSDRAEIEARYYAITGQWQQAIKKYNALCEISSDDLELGLQLVHAQTMGGQGDEALGTIAGLRKLPAPASSDPRIDLAEALLAKMRGDFKQQLEIATEAVVKSERLGAKLLAAQGRYYKATALQRLGELDSAVVESELAQAAYESAGDLRGAAGALYVHGHVALTRGDMTGAEQLWEQVLQANRKAGNKKGEASQLLNLGVLKKRQGKVEQARQSYQQALDTARGIGDQGVEVRALNNLAGLLQTMGDLAGAHELFSEGLVVVRALGDRNSEAVFLYNMASIDLGQGSLSAAWQGFNQALAIFEETGDRARQAFVQTGIGQTLFEQDELAQAEQRLTAAAAIYDEIGQPVEAMECRIWLARAVLEQGRPADAAAIAQKVAEAATDDPEVEAEARAVWSTALLSQNQPAEANQVFGKAQDLARDSDDIQVRLPVAVAAACVQAATGDATAAIEALTRHAEEAHSRGVVRLELVSRLALGCCELHHGDQALGRSRLSTLARDARTQGFVRIARKAEDALQAEPK
jgi:serine/threonine protein kinase/tetratricopeptide (TPR) repeat protein